MNGFHIFTALLAIFVSSSYYSHAQWVQTNGPLGGYISSLAFNGSDIFAGTHQHGVYHSTDNGQTWTYSGLNGQSISSLATSDSCVFAGASGYQSYGVYLSTNNGQSWKPRGLDSLYIEDLVLSGSDIFAATNGVYRSTDNGQSWTQAGLNGRWVSALNTNGSSILAGTFWSLQDSGVVFLSTNRGQTWTRTLALSSGLYISSFAAKDSIVFASASPPDGFASANGGSFGVYLSTDYGRNWTYAGPPADVRSLAVTDSTIYAAGGECGLRCNGHIYRSTNNGVTWTRMGYNGVFVSSLAWGSQGIFAGTGGGVYSSTDNGQNWVQSGVVNGIDIRCLTTSDDGGESNIFAGTQNGVYRTTNNGQDWTHAGLDGLDIRSLGVSGSNILAGDIACDKVLCVGVGINLSTNNGQTWTVAGANGSAVSSFAVNDADIFAGARGFVTWGVFRSTDNGQTWSYPQPNLDRIVYSLAVSGSKIFAGTANYYAGGTGVYLSTDNGQTWTQKGLNNQFVSSLAVVGPNIFAATYNPPARDVYLSTNDGQTWTSTSLNSAYTNALAVSGTKIFAGTSNGVYLSTNSGTSWTQVNTGLTNTYVYALAVSGTNLFAGTYGGGVWRRPLSEMITSIETISADLPTQFRLHQNYPNPFNPSTVIRFSVPSSKFVTLKVYNALGQEVATLVNEVKQPGSYDLTWDASGMASGVYLYRLQAGGYIDTKKLILLK